MNKHEQCLGLTQSRRRVCNTTCMCRLTLAWVTSENSTKQLECRHLLTRSSSLDPIFSAGLTAPVSGVDCPCPWFHANSPSSSLQPTLSRPLTTSGYGEISGPKILCLVFAPKQTKESSTWRATYIVLQFYKDAFNIK